MTTSATSPAPAGLPDRTVPHELVDLAVLAIRRGAQRVSLGHESLGYEFQAPIGWMLWIGEADENGAPKRRATLISHQVGCSFDDFVLPEHLAADDTSDEPVIDSLLELFQAAVKNGWDASYERNIMEHKSFAKIAKEHGVEPYPMRHQLNCTASNWGYDEAARDRGDRVSTNLHLGLGLPVSAVEPHPTDPVAFSDDGGEHRQVDEAHIAALLNETAPNFVPVAYFDYDLDEWVK